MNESEQNKLLLDGFLLGLRSLFQAHDIHVPGTEDHKHWDLLRDVAEGRLTLVSSPAEQLVKFPNMTVEMKDYLARNTNRLIAKDRELARRVLQAMADE